MGMESFNAEPVVPDETERVDDEYAGYSPEGKIEDQEAEKALSEYLQQYAGILDTEEKEYFQIPNPNIEVALKHLDDIRGDVDRGITPQMKSAKNFPSVYEDTFFKKFVGIKFKYSK